MMDLIREGASTFAGDIDSLILVITILTGFWFLVAEGVFFYFCFKFRRKEGRKASYVAGESKAEKKWVSIPHLLILACDVVIVIFAIKVWYEVKQDLPPAEEKIRVVGHQWSWRFVHPGADGKLGTNDDVETVDELHLKKDTLYHFQLEAADVLHSFSIPVFRIKQDAVPGRAITGWFEPTRTGTFDIQCAEICGIGHGVMAATLFVETPKDHKAWLASQETVGDMVAKGLPATPTRDALQEKQEKPDSDELAQKAE